MDFIPSRVAVVDKIGTNTIVRGCAPGDPFNYEGIKSALGLATDPERIIVISLLDNISERSTWCGDFTAYGVNPDNYPKTCWPPYSHIKDWDPIQPLGVVMAAGTTKIPGSLYWWPIEGLPAGAPPKVINTFLKSPGWDFYGCVELLYTLSRMSWMGGDCLVYIHCMLGADRTGALHAGYLMRSKRLSAQQALDTAAKATSAGYPNSDYVNLVTAPTTKVVGFLEPLPPPSPYGGAVDAQQTPARV